MINVLLHPVSVNTEKNKDCAIELDEEMHGEGVGVGEEAETKMGYPVLALYPALKSHTDPGFGHGQLSCSVLGWVNMPHQRHLMVRIRSIYRARGHRRLLRLLPDTRRPYSSTYSCYGSSSKQKGGNHPI